MRDTAPVVSFVYVALGCLLFAVPPALVLAFFAGMYRRADRLLSDWAARNGYRIVESQRHRVWRGPFLLRSSNNQVVYRVTVQDSQGAIHRGWVRCGSYQLGSWRQVVDVRWDE